MVESLQKPVYPEIVADVESYRVKSSKFFAIFAILGLVFSALTAGFFFNSDSATAAPSKESFDPGEIISDTVFFDFGKMDVDQIQKFLQSKANCPDGRAIPCLAKYKTDTRNTSATDTGCKFAIKAKKDRTAAQIIYEVAQACQINPQVLLVTLQKERGLITKTQPTSGDYRVSMGYGCPDTAECDSDYFGFFNQVFLAAQQFNRYVKSPSFAGRYPVGKSSKVLYNPKSSCGSSNVLIKSQATRALYIYTPYQPNAAALNNMYGTGNSCSAYGNRNFWVFFHDWFGSTIGGSYLVKVSGSSKTYLLVDEKRYEFDPKDTATLRAYQSAFGRVGTVTSKYLDSFEDGGKASRLVFNVNDQPILIDYKKRHRFADGCDQVLDYGFNCEDAIRLTDQQMSLFPQTTQIRGYVTLGTTGQEYVLSSGKKHEVIHLEAHEEVLPPAEGEAGAEYPARPLLLASFALDHHEVGTPLLNDLTMVKRTASSSYFYYTGGKFYALSAELIRDSNALKALPAPSLLLQKSSVDSVGYTSVPGLFKDSEGQGYLMLKTGLAKFELPEALVESVTELPQTVLDLFPVTETEWSAPMFLRNDSSSVHHLLSAEGTLQVLKNTAERKVLADTLGIENKTERIPDSTFSSFKIGAKIYAPATVIQESGSGDKWFIDGTDTILRVSTAQIAEITAGKVTKVSKGTINNYPNQVRNPKLGFICNDKYYLNISGQLRPIAEKYREAYGKVFVFREYQSSTCNALKISTTPVGDLLRNGSNYYQIVEGKKKKISSSKASSLAKNNVPARKVSNYLIGLFPNA